MMHKINIIKYINNILINYIKNIILYNNYKF